MEIKLVRSSGRRKMMGLSNKELKTGRKKTGGYGVMWNSNGWLVKVIVEGRKYARSFPGSPDGYRRARAWYNDMREERREHRPTDRTPYVMECVRSFNVVYWAYGKRKVKRFPCHDYDEKERDSTMRLAFAFCLIMSEPKTVAAHSKEPIQIPV